MSVTCLGEKLISIYSRCGFIRTMRTPLLIIDYIDVSLNRMLLDDFQIPNR